MIDDVAKDRTSQVLLVKHNRPVAALVPVTDEFPDPWVTEPTGEVWDADL